MRRVVPAPGFHTTMERAELRDLLLEMAQPVLWAGRGYEIASKHLGAGVYKVWLKPWVYDDGRKPPRKRKKEARRGK